MRTFHGRRKKRRYFEGWYFKHVSRESAFMAIPGISMDERGRKHAFLQIILPDGVHQIDYPASDFVADEKQLMVRIDANVFSSRGIRLDIHEHDLTLRASLDYGKLTEPPFDIMGPFSKIPFMQCKHGVISLNHRVDGFVSIDGRTLDFNGGTGYIETDRGRSFPKRYAWSQGGDWDKGYSVMASVAHIPFAGAHFDGAIAIVSIDSRQYRLATYLGARIIHFGRDRIELGQGAYELTITAGAGRPLPLRAPQGGAMSRTVHETASCPVRFVFSERGRVLLDEYCALGSFEFSE